MVKYLGAMAALHDDVALALLACQEQAPSPPVAGETPSSATKPQQLSQQEGPSSGAPAQQQAPLAAAAVSAQQGVWTSRFSGWLGELLGFEGRPPRQQSAQSGRAGAPAAVVVNATAGPPLSNEEDK